VIGRPVGSAQGRLRGPAVNPWRGSGADGAVTADPAKARGGAHRPPITTEASMPQTPLTFAAIAAGALFGAGTVRVLPKDLDITIVFTATTSAPDWSTKTCRCRSSRSSSTTPRSR
jgi:hypothetical protein